MLRIVKVSEMNWVNAIIVSLVIQLFLVPIIWGRFFPIGKPFLTTLRITFLILLGIVFVPMHRMLNLTFDEKDMAGILTTAFAAIQVIILIILHERRKRVKK